MTATATDRFRCPVCAARFRETPACSRCGVDLGPLMRPLTQAWRLREAARREIGLGRFEKARAYAEAAERQCRTESGRRLLLLTAWLTET